MKTWKLLVVCPPLVLALGLGLACSPGNPVAPSDTILTMTARPSRIDLDGTSTITVIGRRPNGSPLPTGTEIRFSTTLGTIDPLIGQTNRDGEATAILQADGRTGTATVTASVATASGGGGGGGGEGGGGGGGGTSSGTSSVSIDIPIGEPPESQPQVTVTVNPDNIPVGEDSTAQVTVVVRNADNTPADAGIGVTLVTNLGSLDPDQTVTDASGVARSTLTAGLQSGTATVTAFVGSAAPATASLNIRDAATDISLQPDPTTISRGAATIDLVAFVANSQGLPLQGQSVTFESEQGSFDSGNVAFTNQNGSATAVLTIEQGEIPDNVSSFEVLAKTPTGTGRFIEARRTITVR